MSAIYFCVIGDNSSILLRDNVVTGVVTCAEGVASCVDGIRRGLYGGWWQASFCVIGDDTEGTRSLCEGTITDI